MGYYSHKELIERNKDCLAENGDCKEIGEARHDHYGIYAGRLCDKHWEQSSIRKDAYFDADYAGESLDGEYL